MPPSQRGRRARAADAPLVRPRRPRTDDAAALAARLRELHEQAGDPHVETMPAPEELWQLVLYCEQHAARLTSTEAAAEAAMLCVRLSEHMAQRLPAIEGRATRRARDAGAEWEEFTDPYGVGSVSAAHSKGGRLMAADLETRDGVGPLRRTPEAARAAREQLAEAERRRRRRQIDAETRPAALRRTAETVLAAAHDLPRDDDGGMVDFYLDQLAYDLQQGERTSAGALLATLTGLATQLEMAARHGTASTPQAAADAVAALHSTLADPARDNR